MQQYLFSGIFLGVVFKFTYNYLFNCIPQYKNMVLREILCGKMGKIIIGFRGMGFVVRVRRFGEMKITYKIISEILKSVGSCRLLE